MANRVVGVASVVLAASVVAPVCAEIQTPCAGGRELRVYHAYSECRTDARGQRVWHVVTDAYYTCPPSGAAQAFRVYEKETAQPCDEPAPEADGLISELGPTDRYAQEDGEFVRLECINRLWHRVYYQRHRLPDGSVRISKPAKRIDNTWVPCEKERPPVVVQAAAAGERTAGSQGGLRVGGSLQGVVLANRPAQPGSTQILLATPALALGRPIDRVTVKLPKPVCERAALRGAPPGWKLERERERLVLAGPPLAPEEPIAIALDLPATPLPEQAEVELASAGRTVRKERERFERWPGLETLLELDSVVAFPPAVSPGELVSFSVHDGVALPAWGQWWAAGSGARRAGPAPDAASWSVELPANLVPGAAVPLRFVDLWGFDLARGAAPTTVVPSPSELPATPRITAAPASTLLGESFCVCGWFPSEAARAGVFLGAWPLGTPTSASSEVLTFQVPEGVAPGTVVVRGDPAAGFSGDDLIRTEVLSIGGSLDREKLLRGETTPLELWVQGTTAPVTLQLENRTPTIVSITGGDRQDATTSGGADNRLRRDVRGLTPGDFHIRYELRAADCPCAGGSLPRQSEPATLAQAPPTFEACVGSFQRGRDLADRARTQALLGDPQAAATARLALEELQRASELLELGSRNGEIGPLAGASLREYIDGYRDEAQSLADSPPRSELVIPEATGDPAEITVTGTRPTHSVPLDYGLKIAVDWKLDPRDAPPPAPSGEELDSGPVGIVLLRRNDDWIPSWRGGTAVRAKLYEPDPTRPGVWLPSATKRRKLHVRFVERSRELGVSLNEDLPEGPQDAPDLFFDGSKDYIPIRCGDDPTGRGHYGECETRFAENSQLFLVLSEDYGGFSTLEASCEGCVQLTPVPQSGAEFPPAVRDADPRRWRVKLPADGNDNQIADGYFRDRLEYMRADEDSERDPEGDGTRGDGFSAYEEYRGFTRRHYLHERTDPERKTLIVENDEHFPTWLFSMRSGLEVVEIDSEYHRRRVANYNGGHAKLHDQHLLRLWRGPLDKGVAGASFGYGPPKNVDRVVVNLTVSATSELIAHELGHAVGMHHHGDTWWDTTKSAMSDDLREEIRASTGLADLLPGRVHMGNELCGRKLPARFLVGERGDQGSGHATCIMRYNYWREVYRQPAGDYDCMPQGLPREQFCDSPVGNGPNGGHRTASDATVGDCLGQMVVNDAK